MSLATGFLPRVESGPVLTGDPTEQAKEHRFREHVA